MKLLRFLVFVLLMLFSVVVLGPVPDNYTLECISQPTTVIDLSPTLKQKPVIGASAAILYEPKSKTILFSKKAETERAPASTTKIMTAILTLERCALDEVVTISRKASRVGGSQVGLKEGEKHSVEELLWSLLLVSGNDAAIALAEHIAGSVEKFAIYMNTRARELGCQNTNFVNPHGLSAPGHYSSVYDLALITAHALQYPFFQEMVSAKEKEIPWSQSWDRYLKNTNKLLWILEGADGVKTGTTNLAGACLVSSASKDGRQLIAVVLNSRDRWVESARLLKWGFDNFACQLVIGKTETIPDVYVNNGKYFAVGNTNKDIYVTIPKGVQPIIKFHPYELHAPVLKEQIIGVLEVGPILGQTSKQPVYSSSKVGKKNFFRK